MSEPIVKEFKPDEIIGMPQNHPPIKMAGWTYRGATVWEEVNPTGRQYLKAEDIIEKLKTFPDYLVRPVHYVILSPFGNPKDSVFGEIIEITWASCNYDKAQITFFMQPLDEESSKSHFTQKLVLQHEIGHIIGGNLLYRKNFNKSGITWLEAMCLDAQFERPNPNLPKYYVSRYAESAKAESEFNALLEDIAESIAQFSDENNLKIQLKDNYPNRYKILEGLLK
jgi:hypothetical protein